MKARNLPQKAHHLPQKARSLPKLWIIKSLYILLLLSVLRTPLFAQSEPNNPITYDTTITEQANGEGPFTWQVRITRQKNDWTPRPAIFCIPGSGETGTDTNNLTKYGPHYWLENGWDGSVKLENGIHYPIIVTIEQPAQNTRPWHLKACFDQLLSILPIKRNSVHVSGLSQGSYEWGELIEYAASPGDESAMSEITSWVDFEGVGPGDNFSGYNLAYPFGHWAAKYGGRMFGLEGTNDSRNIWQITEQINDSVPNKAYFCYENFGGGAHCCWNSMYDPSQLNWTCVGTVTNTNLSPSVNPASTMGNYFYDPNTGSNVFQWMLRQGDTTLVTGAPVPTPPTVSAGSTQSIQLPADSVTLTGTATAASGHSIASTTWTQTSGPSTDSIASSNNLTTKIFNLTAGTYVFTLTAKDDAGTINTSTVTITVLAEQPPTVSAGSAITVTLPLDSATLTGTATGNGGATIVSTTWTETSGPNTDSISNPAVLTTEITGLIQGTYVYTLTALDNNGNSKTSTVTVTVNAAPVAPPPTVNAGSAQSIQLPVDSVTLTGTATAASGHSIASTTWTQTSGPATYTIVSPTSLTSSVTGLVAGTYVFTLTAKDDRDSASTSMVTVTVLAEQPPTVNAGSGITITLPTSMVTLTGTATGNGGATITSTAWSQTGGAAGPTITSPTTLTTTVTGLAAGTYVFTLTATDNNGNTKSSTVTVTVNAPAPPPPPTVSAGSTVSITLPVNSANLTGTASGNGGATITSTTWTQTSGPNTAVIATPSSLSTAITGLIQGSYVFTLTANDNNGNSNTSTVTVTVNPAVIVLPPPPPGPPTMVGLGEYQVFFLDQTKHLYAVGTNIRTIGTSGNGTAGTTLPVAVPSSLTFRTVAGGLHGGAAVDVNGNVWAWGDNSQGESGNGTVTSTETMTPVQVTTDSSGNTFTGITALCAFFAGNSSSGWYAIKADGTLWVWGQPLDGMRGNGTLGDSFLVRPAQVPIPGNRQVMQVVAGEILIVLCSDGTVWTCGGAAGNPQDLGYAATGNDYLSLHQINVSGITQIAGGSSFNYALASNGKLYGWGYFGFDLGGSNPVATPTDLTNVLNLPHPITSIVTNMVCTHAILSDGTLWGWGDNANGTIGNGIELNYATTATPYAWDFYPNDLLQVAPVQITTRNDFVAVFDAEPFVLYTYAETADGQLYSWGRNKTAVLGNGVVGCNPDVVAAYPNSWDVPLATPVNPLNVTATTVVPSPYCLSHATTTPCNECSNGVVPIANAGAASTITLPVNTATLDGSASTNPGGGTLTYAWTEVSGPSTYTITSPSAATTTVTGLVQGTYTFQLTVTNSLGYQNTATVTVTVNPAIVVTPVANAGSDITITLPVNTTTLDGSASSNPGGGTLTYAWTLVSGPAGSAITSPSAATTTVTGLVQGAYLFQLQVTNTQGQSATANVTVTVNDPASVTPVANAGSNMTITLPVNDTTLDGSASNNPGGGTLTYAWSQISGPSASTITSPSAATTSVTGLVQGTYTYRLTVTNSQGNTATASVTVTVNPAIIPVANAGSAITITLPTNSVTLNGSASSNPGGGTLTYAWSLVSGPAGSTITTPAGSATTVTGLVQGSYQFKLQVTNPEGNSATATVTVIVNPAPQVYPIANAGSNITITLPTNSATLNGGGSSNPGGGTLTYAWTLTSGPTGSAITSASSASTTVTGLVQGVYTYQLQVTNGQGNSATATVTVTVNAASSGGGLVANAGPNQTIYLPTNTVNLDGTKSSDGNGTIVSYNWYQVSGTNAAITIVGSNSSTPEVMDLAAGQYVFELTVTDNHGDTASATVTITVVAQNGNGSSNLVANAGSDTTVSLGTIGLTLNGSGSTDVGGTITGYQWTQMSGPSNASMGNSAEEVCSLGGLQVGQYVFQLTVTDNKGATATASVTIGIVDNLRTSGADQLLIYPNPAQSTLNFQLLSDSTGPVRVNFFDMEGRMIKATQTSKQQFYLAQAIDVSDLAAGTYVMQILIGDKKQITAKVMKQ